MKILTLILSAIVLSGCAKQVTVRPGAVNAFDSQAYDTLITIQGALEGASKEVAAFPAVKPALNAAIDGYNVAMAAYKTYHEAALAGKPTNQAELDALIKKLSATVAEIVSKLKPPATPLKPVATLEWRLA